MPRTVAALLLLAAAVPSAAAQDDTGKAARGAALAERWCVHCHVVGAAGTDAVPPLATVAARRDPDWLRSFLTKPHGAMPDLGLSAEEIEALTSYMETLR